MDPKKFEEIWQRHEEACGATCSGSIDCATGAQAHADRAWLLNALEEERALFAKFSDAHAQIKRELREARGETEPQYRPVPTCAAHHKIHCGVCREAGK